MSAGQCRLMKRRGTAMTYMMICKQHREGEKRFWFCQEREFAMPVPEKQIRSVTKGVPSDT